MTTVSNPVVNVVKTPASTTISNAPQRVLIVGQQTGAVYTTGQLVENISNSNVETENFGKDSHITAMVKSFKKINQLTAIDAIPLDDNGAAVEAEGTIAFTGTTASASGSIVVYIGSKKNNRYSITVASGDTPTVIGDALVSLITADDFALVTAVNTTGSVVLTAVNGGTIGNGIGLQVEGTIAGITNSAIVAMTGGAGDPVLTNLFDVVGNTRYQTVIYPNTYLITALTTDFLDARFNVDNRILDGVGVISKTDTFANLKVFGDALNSQSLIIQGNTPETSGDFYKGASIFEWDDVISSEVGAVRALRRTDGSNIARYVIASNLDTRGGTAISSLPYFNTPMFNLPLVDTGKGWTDTEIKDLNTSGVFVIGNNDARNQVILGKIVTTYKTDVAGNPDLTYKFLNLVDTFSGFAELVFNNARRDFAQTRLTDGVPRPGRNEVGPNEIRAAFISYYITAAGPDFMLTRSGQDLVTFFAENLTITLDLLNGKVTSIQEVPLVVQLRQLDIILKAVFDIS